MKDTGPQSENVDDQVQSPFKELIEYLDREKVLSDELPSACIEDFKKAKDIDDLYKILMNHYLELDDRLIDFLAANENIFELTRKILENLLPRKRLQAFNETNSLTQYCALDVALKKGSRQVLHYIAMNILNHTSFESKFNLLTQSTQCNKRFNHHYSILTCPQLSMEEKFEVLKYFNDQEKEELVLAFEGGARDVNLLLLAAHGGYLDELLDLFSDEKLKDKLKNYVHTYYQRKKAAHLLGLSNRKREEKKNPLKKKLQPKFEGTYDFFALPMVREALHAFRPSDDFTLEFNQINEAFDFIKLASPQKGEHIGRNVELDLSMEEALLKRYIDGKLIVIPSGWPLHSISIGAISIPGKGDFLVVGNRGAGKGKGGCIIYELEQPLTAEDIKVFINKKSQANIQERIKQIVKKNSDNEPILFHALPLKQQGHGTCATANKKALVAGLLVLLKHINSPETSQGSRITTEASSLASKEYKKFTNHTRHLTITDLIVDLNNHILNENEIIEALADYCNQHLNVEKQSELELLDRVFREIPEHAKETFLGLIDPHVKVLLYYLNNHGISLPIPQAIKHLIAAEKRVLSKEETQETIEFLLAHQGEILLTQNDLQIIINNFHSGFYSELIIGLLVRDAEKPKDLMQFLEFCASYPNLQIVNKPLSDILILDSKNPKEQISALASLVSGKHDIWSTTQTVRWNDNQSRIVFHMLLEKINPGDIENKKDLEAILGNFYDTFVQEIIGFVVFRKEPSICTGEELKHFLERYASLPDVKIGRYDIGTFNQLVQRHREMMVPVSRFPDVMHTFHLRLQNQFKNCRLTASYEENDNIYAEYNIYPIGGDGAKLFVNYDQKNKKLNLRIEILGKNGKNIDNGRKLSVHFFEKVMGVEKSVELKSKPEILNTEFFKDVFTLRTEFSITGNAFKTEHDIILEWIEASALMALQSSINKRYLKIIIENARAKDPSSIFQILSNIASMGMGNWNEGTSRYIFRFLCNMVNDVPDEKDLQRIINKLNIDIFEPGDKKISALELEKYAENFADFAHLPFRGKPFINICIKNREIKEEVILKMLKKNDLILEKLSQAEVEELYLSCFECGKFNVACQLMKKDLPLPEYDTGKPQPFTKFIHYLSKNYPKLYQEHFEELSSFAERNYKKDSELFSLVVKLEEKSQKRALTFDYEKEKKNIPFSSDLNKDSEQEKIAVKLSKSKDLKSESGKLSKRKVNK